ncbi:helix-turn-helix domain-containing protein [Caballeronia sp. J97]|uniref:helix-turn-helix domain-containing protein n=1 Tax=Caballeronia sp. J97 TaxID=2805429 RepID=UPI0039F0A5F8
MGCPSRCSGLFEAYSTKTSAPVPGTLDSVSRKRICDFVEERLGGNLSVTEIASQVGLGAHHFTELFKRTFGESPYQYVLKKRIERAKTMLTSTDQPTALIALDLGFSGQSHFTQAFKRQTGFTPGAFRADRPAA